MPKGLLHVLIHLFNSMHNSTQKYNKIFVSSSNIKYAIHSQQMVLHREINACLCVVYFLFIFLLFFPKTHSSLSLVVQSFVNTSIIVINYSITNFLGSPTLPSVSLQMKPHSTYFPQQCSLCIFQL